MVLPKLPKMIPDMSSNQKEEVETYFREVHMALADALLGAKTDGERPGYLVDWTVESYWAETGEGGQRCRMFRAFDMI